MDQNLFMRFVLSYIQKYGDSIDSPFASTLLSQLNEEEKRKSAQPPETEQEEVVSREVPAVTQL